MVEIMLAVIVIALGIAGTFVLFPVGLNANKDATAENSIADIAEYVTAFVRAECLRRASNANEGAFTTSSVSSVFSEARPAIVDNVIEVESIDATKWRVPVGSVDISKASLLEHSTERGIYLIRQLSGPDDDPFVDFSAVARVYIDGGNNLGENTSFDKEVFFRDRDVKEKYENTKGNVNIFKFLLPAVLELSWPATVPYADREKRYFRFEIFNSLYEKNKENSPAS